MPAPSEVLRLIQYMIPPEVRLIRIAGAAGAAAGGLSAVANVASDFGVKLQLILFLGLQ